MEVIHEVIPMNYINIRNFQVGGKKNTAIRASLLAWAVYLEWQGLLNWRLGQGQGDDFLESLEVGWCFKRSLGFRTPLVTFFEGRFFFWGGKECNASKRNSGGWKWWNANKKHMGGHFGSTLPSLIFCIFFWDIYQILKPKRKVQTSGEVANMWAKIYPIFRGVGCWWGDSRLPLVSACFSSPPTPVGGTNGLFRRLQRW